MEKQRKIYIRNSKSWIPVSEEVYLEYYRPVWRLQKEAQKRGQCVCPRSKLWLCDGDCAMCEYQAAGNTISLDAPMRNDAGEEFCLWDTLEDPTANIEESVADKLLLEELFRALDELDPDSRRICELIRQGKSEREIADEFVIRQSTLNYRKRKLMDSLRERLKDFK